MESERVKEVFRVHGKVGSYSEYEDAYNGLLKRREYSCKAYPGENLGEPMRIRLNAFTYRQVLLHRAIFCIGNITPQFQNSRLVSPSTWIFTIDGENIPSSIIKRL